MKQALIIVCLFFCSTIHAQLTLSGKIISESNLPLSKAVVTVKQKTTIKKTLAEDNGTYTITGLTAGSWQVTVAALGYEASGETIVLNKGLRQLNFVLSASIKELQTVEVTGRSAKKYNSDYSFSATKTAMLTRDIPQSIATVTKELIADRQAFQLADAVKIIPGVIPASFYNQYTIRGISQNEEGQIINGMRTRQHYFLQPLTTHIGVNGQLWWLNPLKSLLALALRQKKLMSKKTAFFADAKLCQKMAFIRVSNAINVLVASDDLQI